MTAEELMELQNRVGDMEEAVRILWSTLEAVYDAMRVEFATPETYQDALYGLSRQAYYLKQELELLVEWLNDDERNCP